MSVGYAPVQVAACAGKIEIAVNPDIRSTATVKWVAIFFRKDFNLWFPPPLAPNHLRGDSVGLLGRSLTFLGVNP